MEVKLIHSTPIWTISNAIRMSRDNHHLSDTFEIQNLNSVKDGKQTCRKCGEVLSMNTGEPYWDFYCSTCDTYTRPCSQTGKKDFELIKRVGIKMKHSSTLEFGYFIFEIDGISRACLQETSRHRHTNLTVKSTRYTLKELRNESDFKITKGMGEKEATEIFKRSSKYLVMTDDTEANIMSINALENLRYLVSERGISNDIAKYSLPEAFKTKLQWGINLRSLTNFLELRLAKDALWEIRELAKNILDVLKSREPEYFELLMENEKIKNDYNETL